MNASRPRNIFCIGAGMAVACCAHFAKYQHEIGTAHVSVVGVESLGDRLDDLSPTFSLSAEDALTKVTPYVSAETDSFETILRLSLGLKVAVSSDTTSGSGGSGNDGGTGGGDKVSAGGSDKTDGGDGASGSASQVPALTPVSPIAQYQLATALFQEVKLLNSALRAFSAAGNDVYLVAIDVALFTKRAANYDADVVISFAPDPGDLPCLKNDELGLGIEVLPLVSQDSIELNRHELSIKHVTELAFALSASGSVAKAPFDLLADLGIDKNTAKSILGRDVNPLQVVARGAPGSLIARFGATDTVEPARTLYSQTRRIYSAIVVPRPMTEAIWQNSGRLNIVSQVRFHPTDGKSVPPTRSAKDTATEEARAFENDLGLRFYDHSHEEGVEAGETTCAARLADGRTTSIANEHDGKSGPTPKPADDVAKRERVAASDAFRQLRAGYVESDARLLRKITAWVDTRGMTAAQVLPAIKAELATLDQDSLWSTSPFWLPSPSMDAIVPRTDGSRLRATAGKTTLSVSVPVVGNVADPGRWWLKYSPRGTGQLVVPAASVNGLKTSLAEVTFAIPSSDFEKCDDKSKQGCAIPPGTEATLLYIPLCARVKISDDPAKGVRGDCRPSKTEDQTRQKENLTRYAQVTVPTSTSAGSATPSAQQVQLTVSSAISSEPAKQPNPMMVILTRPVAADPSGRGLVVVSVDPTLIKHGAKTITFVAKGSSAVIEAAKAFPVPAQKTLFELPLESLIPGQEVTLELSDDKGGTATDNTIVVAQPSSPHERK
jgi:hypothetical protein